MGFRPEYPKHHDAEPSETQVCGEGLQFTYRTVPLVPYSASMWSGMLVRTNVSRMMGRGLTVGVRRSVATHLLVHPATNNVHWLAVKARGEEQGDLR